MFVDISFVHDQDEITCFLSPAFDLYVFEKCSSYKKLTKQTIITIIMFFYVSLVDKTIDRI